ncbi:MAG: hypothetical protein ACTHMI_04560 [Mucilaginibacter sp.]
MINELTIPKQIDAGLGPEYSLLRAEGMQHIRNLASAIWTDYNVHDPGVTILEMLCYALTDLNYRVTLPIENILAAEENNDQNMHRQFLSALKILPSYPVTADDYRQLFVRIDGVRNAWITKSAHSIVANYKQPDGTPLLHFKQPAEVIESDKEIEFALQGINNILIDFEEFPELNGDAGAILAKQNGIIKQVRSVYHYFRNLCEDLDQIKAVDKQEIVICAEIELKAEANPEQVWAEIMFKIEQYLNPDIHFYSLKEMLEKGIPADEIFEGPVFDFAGLQGIDLPVPFAKQGFVVADELAASQLRTEVRLSDLYRIVMNIDGVKLVKKISFAFCGCTATPADVASQVYNSNAWLLCVAPGCKPVLCENNSSFTFYKDVIPMPLKQDLADGYLQQLRDEQKSGIENKLIEDLPIPEGDFRDIAHYETLQNQFPENYGISPAGLPETAGEERQALALQLKGYLLFFDQVLANYFSQLANVKVLLSADDTVRKTYYNNVVNGIRDAGKLVDQAPQWQQMVDEVMAQTGLDNYIERKNKFIDHLLARFAEQFNEYVFLMYRVYGEDYQCSIIRHKVNFLKEYDQMSACRGSAMDMYNQKTADQDATNVSGMEKRISRLLGFTNYKRQALSQESYAVFKPDATHYNWTILKGADIIFKGNGTFTKEIDAYEDLGSVAVLACDRENYYLKPSPTAGKVIYDIANAEGTLLTLNDMEIDGPQVEQYISDLIGYLCNDFKMEGLYVIENILLRPPFDYTGDDATHHQFMPVCIDANGEYCKPLDPYSFRISVILPGYSIRLRDTAFRTYAEKLIRMETPAHVLPRICFIGHDQMVDFEKQYQKWLDAKHTSVRNNTAMDATINTDFINLLEKLYTVYQAGHLSTCDETDVNPIILNKSSLGSLQNDATNNI